MIVTNIRIEEPSDNPSLAQQSLSLWSSAFSLAATMAFEVTPMGYGLAMMRLGRACAIPFSGSAGARTDQQEEEPRRRTTSSA